MRLLVVAALLSACGAETEEAPPARSSAEHALPSAPVIQEPPAAATEPVVEEVAEVEEAPEPAWQPRADDPGEAPHAIEDPSGNALDGFYAALARTEAGGEDALTRVSHMGDSSVGMDQLPHYLRVRFQDRFGEGGAGFVLLQPHSPNYRNQMVRLSTPSEWGFCFIIFRCSEDGHYGLGGVTAESYGGATSIVETHRRGERGRSASRVELWYAGMPNGGGLQLTIDDDEPIAIDTEADALEDRWHEIDVEPGEHRVRVRSTGGGKVRAYGLVLETDGPGVVWDTHSMIGAFTMRMLAYDEEHFTRQLQHRRTNLVVLGYGGNDLRRFVSRGVTIEDFREETRQFLTRVKQAVPDAGCLLTGVMEHERSGQMRVRTEHVEAVVGAQRAAAADAGCAFYDVYGAMGGQGSFGRWRREGLASADRKHLTPRGRRQLADWMYQALFAGYAAYRQR